MVNMCSGIPCQKCSRKFSTYIMTLVMSIMFGSEKCTHAHTSHTHIHVHTHVHIHIHTCTHIYTYTCTITYTYAHACVHTHRQTKQQAYTQTGRHTHTQTHTHRVTNMHTHLTKVSSRYGIINSLTVGVVHHHEGPHLYDNTIQDYTQ